MTLLLIFLTCLFLVCAKMYAPWGLSAAISLIFFIISIAVCYYSFGIKAAVVCFFALLIGFLLIAKEALRLARKLSPSDPLAGKLAIALTELRPSGYILVENIRYQAECRERVVEKGEQVTVVERREGFLVVKPLKGRAIHALHHTS